jgi:hypothetical protein
MLMMSSYPRHQCLHRLLISLAVFVSISSIFVVVATAAADSSSVSEAASLDQADTKYRVSFFSTKLSAQVCC